MLFPDVVGFLKNITIRKSSSFKKLKEILAKEDMVQLQLQLAVIVEHGKILANTCYELEGDDSLIFVTRVVSAPPLQQ